MVKGKEPEDKIDMLRSCLPYWGQGLDRASVIKIGYTKNHSRNRMVFCWENTDCCDYIKEGK